MAAWFWYAVLAAVLYGAHQIFTRLAAQRIGDGLGGFIVETSAALSILIYLAILWSFPKRRTAFGCPRDSGRRCRNHGRRGNFVFPRNTVMAAIAWDCVCDCGTVSAAQVSQAQISLKKSLKRLAMLAVLPW